jgi:hypothetical protein
MCSRHLRNAFWSTLLSQRKESSQSNAVCDGTHASAYFLYSLCAATLRCMPDQDPLGRYTMKTRGYNGLVPGPLLRMQACGVCKPCTLSLVRFTGIPAHSWMLCYLFALR